MSDPKTLLVRLKPHNPRIGHKLRKYVAEGYRFEERLGWYEVPAGLARKLETHRQDCYDPGSPLAFDVCTREQAEALENRESVVQERAPVGRANAPRKSVETARRPTEKPRGGGPQEMLQPDDEGEDDDDTDGLVPIGRVSGNGDKPAATRRRRKK